VVDRYRVGQIVSVEVADNRVSREWLDAIAAKRIEAIETGAEIGIEEGVAVTLDKSGWVRIDAGATSVGIGVPGSGSRVDVMVLDKVTDKTVAWLKVNRPQIVVTHAPVELDRLVEGIAFIGPETRSIELVFDEAHWSIYESP